MQVVDDFEQDLLHAWPPGTLFQEVVYMTLKIEVCLFGGCSSAKMPFGMVTAISERKSQQVAEAARR